MSVPASRPWAESAAGPAVAVLVGSGAALGWHVGNLHNGLIAASFTAAGLFLRRRRPGDREGLLLAATGVAHAVMYFGRQYGLHEVPLPGANWLAWLGVWPLPLVLALVGVTLMCFPTGRLPSPGWAPVAGAMVLLGGVLSATSALWPVEYLRVGLAVPPPFRLPGAAAATDLYDLARPVTYLLFQVVWVACVVTRLVRAPREEARPLRWFVLAAALSGVVMAAGLAVLGSPVPGVLTVPVLAAAAAAGVLRLRRATPYEALSRVSEAASGASPDVLEGLCAAVADGVGARVVTLWTGPPEALSAVAGWPAGRALPPGPRALADLAAPVAPVVHEGRTLGALALEVAPGEDLTPVERRLLADLAAQAGLLLRLQLSAHRLVTAQDEARRRIERDLHDGVQQQLVTVAGELGRLARAAGPESPEAEHAEQIRGQLLHATAELRELARGLHPAVLTQDGLEAALGQLADRSGVPVRLEVELSRRPPAEVEATAYFLVAEALTNTAKHAGAGVVTVRATLAAAGLAVEVRDDGGGGARVDPGGGLEGLQDRLAALGARLELASGPEGTRVATVIPCG